MEEINQFNVRVYALIVHEDALLVIKEPYAGEILYKFPGGGIEFGEGLVAGLQRELMEELNLEIESYQHFYTHEDFLRSKFKPNEQLFLVYYYVVVKDLNQMDVIDPNIEELIWIPISELTTDLVNLPTDKIVAQKLLNERMK
ncbi:MAG: NUDIX domain-containing protein [Weeksellaceae bacterium]|nr:NUDIX domain-containing protein [Weeksellaceae bacterium]